MSYNKITIVGNLGRDPEMKYMADGAAVTNFSVAVSDGWGDKKVTIWVRVSVFGKQAEACNRYLAKGAKVLVDGRLSPDKETGNPRIWTNNAGEPQASYEVVASQVVFLSSLKDSKESDFE